MKVYQHFYVYIFNFNLKMVLLWNIPNLPQNWNNFMVTIYIPSPRSYHLYFTRLVLLLYQLILLFDAFQSKLKTSVHSLHRLQHSYYQLELSIHLKFFFWCKIYIQWNAHILNVHSLSFDADKPPWRYRTLPSLQKVSLCPFPGKRSTLDTLFPTRKALSFLFSTIGELHLF